MDQIREPRNDAEARRRTRFTRLPDRIRIEDTVEERPAAPRASADAAVTPDWWLARMGGV
ncbi:hypothetical protein HTV80_24210 [Streptomyces sp. Vc74B-19]|uniref:hypothetical protein n=1 Tax=unclassified Streptomyces TaxID=2593676 RepID=UPI001BFCBFA1|nr:MULTISPECIES: hypothetical protein [unclassified Streptomyces]MBT3166185.1 hypothetical protein [Streptomyces sp. Vc74B-19]MCO4696517.1 hypothetical protein [Streptomyces sp. RO-S4]MDU0304175.1 hypothetical protein [Streptomyces sp. PAL114]